MNESITVDLGELNQLIVGSYRAHELVKMVRQYIKEYSGTYDDSQERFDLINRITAKCDEFEGKEQ